MPYGSWFRPNKQSKSWWRVFYTYKCWWKYRCCLQWRGFKCLQTWWFIRMGWAKYSIQTGQGVTFMDNTPHIASFADFESFDPGKLIQKVGAGAKIVINSDWAYQEITRVVGESSSFLGYALNANNGQTYDIKSDSPGGVYYGSRLYSWGTPTYAPFLCIITWASGDRELL